MKKIKIILRAKEKDGTDMHPHTRRQIKKTKHTFKKKGGGGRKRMDGSWIRQLELSHVVGSFRPHPNADWRLSDIAASKSWPALPPVFHPFNPTHLRKPHAPLFPTWSDAKRKRTSTPEQRHSNSYTFDPFWLCLLFPPLFIFLFFSFMCRRSKCYSCSPVACHLNRPLPLLQFFFIFEGQWIVLFDLKNLLSSKHIDHVCLVWLMISSCFPSFFFFNDKSQWQPSCFLGILFDGFCNLCCACPRAIPPSFFESLKWVWILIWRCYLSSLNEPLNCEFPPLLIILNHGWRSNPEERKIRKEREKKKRQYLNSVHANQGQKKITAVEYTRERGKKKKEIQRLVDDE